MSDTGEGFFSFCCGILSLLYFHCFNAYFFFLPFIPFKENCIYTKWVPFCEKLLKQRLIDRAIVKDGTPTRASVLLHQEPPTWEWFPSGVLTAFGLWRSYWETYIYFFGQIDLFFLRRAGLERFERRQIYKYQSQNIHTKRLSF